MTFNRERAIDYMSRCNLDVLVATSSTIITYFSGSACWLDSKFKQYMMMPGASDYLMPTTTFVVFPVEGAPTLVIDALFSVNTIDSWIDDLYLVGNISSSDLPASNIQPDSERVFFDSLDKAKYYTQPVKALLSLLKSRGLADSRIGLEMDRIHPDLKASVDQALPRASIKDCSNLIRLIRRVKTEEEINHLARATEIGEKAANKSVNSACAGQPISDVVQSYRSRIAKQGADFEHFAYSLHGLGIATEPDYLLTDEDFLFVDFGCTYRNYVSDNGFTLAMRPLSGKQLDKYKTLHACIQAGVDTIAPGVKSSEIQTAMAQVLDQQNVQASLPHGHGLGLKIRDYPIIVPKNDLYIRDDCVEIPSDLPLETNMVVNLEASIFRLEMGPYTLSNPFLSQQTDVNP
ncbi:TPA: aminopeptidase P family protein [Candidatus Poribacteria bacterium]|nr:aminopeptidase P family protein [Candidatus Poribacteria bacterium]